MIEINTLINSLLIRNYNELTLNEAENQENPKFLSSHSEYKEESDKRPESDISCLKLQKLLYYCQGFHLALLDKPLFQDPIHAWRYGPVVQTVYYNYKGHSLFGNNYIPFPDDKDLDALLIPEESHKIIEDVYVVYGQFSASHLVQLTHQEAPWEKTQSNAEITHDAMKDYFKTRLKD